MHFCSVRAYKHAGVYSESRLFTTLTRNSKCENGKALENIGAIILTISKHIQTELDVN